METPGRIQLDLVPVSCHRGAPYRKEDACEVFRADATYSALADQPRGAAVHKSRSIFIH